MKYLYIYHNFLLTTVRAVNFRHQRRRMDDWELSYQTVLTSSKFHSDRLKIKTGTVLHVALTHGSKPQ